MSTADERAGERKQEKRAHENEKGHIVYVQQSHGACSVLFCSLSTSSPFTHSPVVLLEVSVSAGAVALEDEEDDVPSGLRPSRAFLGGQGRERGGGGTRR